MEMRITVNFSSLFRSLAGVDQVELEAAGGVTADRLLSLLAQKYPDLPLERDKTFFLLNGQIAKGDQMIREGDQIRLFQLSAGG